MSSWVDFQDFLKCVLSFLKGQHLVFVTLQLLFLQSDHNLLAGRGSIPQQETHRFGHGHRTDKLVKECSANSEQHLMNPEVSLEWHTYDFMRGFKKNEEKNFFHSVFVFYCRMCLHSISSESVCNHDFMFNSLHDIYAVMFSQVCCTMRGAETWAGTSIIQTVPQPVQVHTKWPQSSKQSTRCFSYDHIFHFFSFFNYNSHDSLFWPFFLKL